MRQISVALMFLGGTILTAALVPMDMAALGLIVTLVFGILFLYGHFTSLRDGGDGAKALSVRALAEGRNPEQHAAAHSHRLTRRGMLRKTGRTARMIVRIWHGRTERSKADAYARFLEDRAIPDYRSVAGLVEVGVLRRDEGDVTHFLTVTRWESEEAIRAFAGADILRAKYYPEDRDFLLEFEPEVEHYSVVATG